MLKNLNKQILETINIKKTVTMSELCAKFNISESSCRRALRKLDELGLISRFHGGANSLDKTQKNFNIHSRFEKNAESKEAIAKEAALKIKPNSTIIMLGGTTVFRMCKFIKNMKLTIITNSMIVFNELSDRPGIEIILLGGLYNRDEAELRGVLTVTNSKLFICDHLFMGADGYIRNAGFTTSDVDSIELYLWCIALSQETNVLFDSSKFGKRGKAITAPVKDISCVITDFGFPKEYFEDFTQYKVSVITAEK